MRKTCFFAFALIAVLGCTTTAQQTTPPPTQPQAQPKNTFKNLQVLPKDISRDELITLMKSFTRSLGVRCKECHVVTATEPDEKFDFPSDAKEDKAIARTMIRMTMDINRHWLQELPEAKRPKPGSWRVGCWTCHRGSKEPEAMAPPRQPPPPPPGS